LGQLGNAEKSFREVLKVNPNNVDAHMGLAKTYEKWEIPMSAFEHVKRALALEPHNPAPRWLLGELYRSEGRFTEAIASYLDAMRRGRRDVSLLRALGAAYKAEGQLGEAIGVLTEALSESPEDAMAHYELGEIYLTVKEYSRAEQEFTATLTSKPLCPGCYAKLGRIHLVRKEPREAVSAFRKALKLDPSNAAAKSGLEEAISARF
jgi:Flp pilus assembly protein TadD